MDSGAVCESSCAVNKSWELKGEHKHKVSLEKNKFFVNFLTPLNLNIHTVLSKILSSVQTCLS